MEIAVKEKTAVSSIQILSVGTPETTNHVQKESNVWNSTEPSHIASEIVSFGYKATAKIKVSAVKEDMKIASGDQREGKQVARAGLST